MKLPGYYSSGEFARMAHVSVRTIRFYDKQNILKPSYVKPSGARFYTDSDFTHLQQILLLKYLGFSLEDIRGMLVGDLDPHLLRSSLQLQKKLIQDRIEQMQLVENAIENAMEAMKAENQIDWSRMLELIHLTGMEKSLKVQYEDAGNISARIRLHRDYSKNPEGWFPWIYRRCGIKSGVTILEIGCGNGVLWTENRERLPDDISLFLSDKSEGMLRDARRNIGTENKGFSFLVADAHQIPFPDMSFDRVIANHLLFYCEDIHQVCREAERVMKSDGWFICSTYGKKHMKEITDLVKEFDERIVLSGEVLYEKFGLENGESILKRVFSSVKCEKYEDEIYLDRAEPLIEYILSCHGNQNQLLLNRYKEFRDFVEQRIASGFRITKDAGVFICEK